MKLECLLLYFLHIFEVWIVIVVGQKPIFGLMTNNLFLIFLESNLVKPISQILILSLLDGAYRIEIGLINEK